MNTSPYVTADFLLQWLLKDVNVLPSVSDSDLAHMPKKKRMFLFWVFSWLVETSSGFNPVICIEPLIFNKKVFILLHFFFSFNSDIAILLPWLKESPVLSWDYTSTLYVYILVV